MIRWIPYTFVRTVAFFIGGILLGIYRPDGLPEKHAILLLIFGVVFYMAFYFAGKKIKRVVNPGYLALPVVFLGGYVHLLTQTESRERDHLISFRERISAYRVKLVSYTEQKERSWKVTGEIQQVKTADEWKQKHGKTVLYFSKEYFKIPFAYGDVLLIHGSPGVLESAPNPHEFDYKHYLNSRNIFHRHFINHSRVVRVDHSPSSIVIDYALRARIWAAEILCRHVEGLRERAVATALVLGVTEGLDDELLDAYSGSGAMHVLAVSGLHISIIYFIISLFMKPLEKKKHGPRMIACVSIVILWGYAFVTGLSPSVLRAVAMFTFIVVARATSRHTNIYNTLAASGFCLLMWDPYLVMSVGFQLSYLAVIGIIYIHPLLYNLWEPDSWLVNEVWKITSVSVAAQIATFPLGLLYFQQFPNYFLVSNLVVIPLSFVVLVLGLSVLATAFLPVVAWVLGTVLGLCIKVLNASVVAIEALPMSVSENIHITVCQCILLLLLIICVLLMLQHKQYRYFRFSIVLVLMYVCAQWIYFINAQAENKMTVYKINGHSAMDLSGGGMVYFFGDTMLMRDPLKMRYHIVPNRTAMRASSVVPHEDAILREIPGGKVIAWKNKLILQITNDIFIPRKIPKVDFVVIGHDAVKDLKRINQLCQEAIVVFDSSNSFSYVERMLRQSKSLSMRTHSVLHEGAFEFIISGNS